MTVKFEDYKKYLSPALAKTTDLVIESGKGCYVTDVNGDVYLDFVQGIAVNAFGHSYPRIIDAMKEQLDKLTDASFNLVNYPTTLKLAKRLSEITPGDLNCVFFSNSGGEACDAALKLAKAYTKRPCIIAFRGSFHGRTLGATSVTGSASKYRKHYEPLVGGVHFVPYPYPYRWGYAEETIDPEICAAQALGEIRKTFDYLVAPEDAAAVIIEPVMGEGGYIVPPVSFMKGLRELCTKHGILLIFDEVQSGYGRTGKMWASEHFGVVPDIMTSGKAIAGGFPMSAVISTEEIMSKWLPGMHGSTFGGHPVAAAGALAVLDAMKEENILENVNKMGEYLRERLAELQRKFPIMGDVRGLGLMTAVEFINPADKSPNGEGFAKLRRYALENKLLLLGCGVYGNGLRFATPLNVTKEELDKGLAIVEKGLASI
jgi:4-aminobutyrate aminotransferase